MCTDDITSFLKTIFNGDDFQIEQIKGGGSCRHFFRIYTKNGSFILMVSQKPETKYISLGKFFKVHSILAPHILSYSKDHTKVVMEDLGDKSLQQFVLRLLKEEKEEEVIKIYCQVIDELLKIQKIPIEKLPIPIPTFDYEYYRWESNYFKERCLQKIFNIEEKDLKELEDDFHTLAKILSTREKVLVHRDFQSQNIHIKNGNTYILDFQSARTGDSFYDVASLIKDPYVKLPKKIQGKILKYYIGITPLKHLMDIEMFKLISIQRLMQALGAYGKLGIEDGKEEFLKYIPPALHLLMETLEEVSGFYNLKSIIKQVMNKNINTHIKLLESNHKKL